jgi:hypothetical protein
MSSKPSLVIVFFLHLRIYHEDSIRELKKVGPAGFEPATKRLCIPPQLSLPLSGLWAGLSLHPGDALPGACRPVSTPSHRWAWLGITIPCGSGFPEFDRQSLENCFSSSPLKPSALPLSYGPLLKNNQPQRSAGWSVIS